VKCCDGSGYIKTDIGCGGYIGRRCPTCSAKFPKLRVPCTFPRCACDWGCTAAQIEVHINRPALRAKPPHKGLARLFWPIYWAGRLFFTAKAALRSRRP
jgi:hypothetical protein